MTCFIDALEIRFAESDYGLSARRLWEHTEQGQINVFKQGISQRSELNQAEAFIDIIRFDGKAHFLLGLTLAEAAAGVVPLNSGHLWSPAVQSAVKTIPVLEFIEYVGDHLDRCSVRQAVRNQHHQFLPNAEHDDCFGVPYVFSTLKRRLLAMHKAKASADQWLKTIENFQRNGLRSEEIECSDLMPELAAFDQDDEQSTGAVLAEICCFKDLRISVIPVVSDAERQLRFAGAPERALPRAKKVPKGQVGQARGIAGFDPILGYRVEQVEHQTLWGVESHWHAVMHDGTLLEDIFGQTLLPTKEAATQLATSHAQDRFPKRVALGNYGDYAWTGGESYREWLFTLPYYPASFLGGHFEIRNVLAHVRCDVREGTEHERILMLHEVQSDWAQRARRAISKGHMDTDDPLRPPFLKEWPALVMKLVLLHACHEGFDAVAWTRGVHQIKRYAGLGEGGLVELYDRTLPKEVGRMVKQFGGACEELGVFVPTNFRIRQTEDGYAVYTIRNELLGVSRTLEEAQQFVPDGGHELLYDVAGVSLPAAMRRAILATGFPAWG